jgi:hypothetical protein
MTSNPFDSENPPTLGIEPDTTSNDQAQKPAKRKPETPQYKAPPIRLDARGQLPKMITMGQLCFMINKHRSVINRWLAKGLFLPPYQWPGGGLFWFEDELLEYIANLPKRGR